MPRPYRSALRQQQADATRSRVLASAAKLFAADGYARTTMAKIAADAGVSAETVQLHGPKAALLIAAIENEAVGVSGEDNILNLDIGRKIVAIDDPAEALDSLTAAQTDIHVRCAELGMALIGAASADPELDRYLNDLTAGVVSQFRRVLETFRDRGWLRTDVAFDEMVETVAVLASMEVFLRMTRRDGWSVAAYRGWARRMMAEAVMVRST